MASTINWPVYLPQLAEVSFEIPDTRLVSQMDIGPAKVRNRYTYAPISIMGRLILNAQQVTEFLTFYQITLVHGSLSFNWEHPVTDETIEMRFKSLGSVELFKTGHVTDRVWTLPVVLEIIGAA